MFFIYGMHWQFNIVTGGVGEPHAVLIRAVEPVAGVELMAERRSLHPESPLLTNGPGKLCAALGLEGSLYGASMVTDTIHLLAAPRVRAARSPRIGVDYAGAWASKPWRFFDANSRYVSPNRPGHRGLVPARRQGVVRSPKTSKEACRR